MFEICFSLGFTRCSTLFSKQCSKSCLTLCFKLCFEMLTMFQTTVQTVGYVSTCVSLDSCVSTYDCKSFTCHMLLFTPVDLCVSRWAANRCTHTYMLDHHRHHQHHPTGTHWISLHTRSVRRAFLDFSYHVFCAKGFS